VVISPFRHQVQMDVNEYAEQTWAALRNAIEEIFARNTSNLSYEELYRYAYTMVLRKLGHELYSGVEKTIREHLARVAGIVAGDALQSDDDHLMREFQQQWESYLWSLKHIREILMYMDRTYVMVRKLKSVRDLGIALFCELVARDSRIQFRVQRGIVAAIDRERRGGMIDWQLMKAVAKIMSDLGVYRSDLEAQILNSTTEYYSMHAQHCTQSMSCLQNLEEARERLADEQARCERYLDSHTGPKLRAIVLSEMVEKQMVGLIDMNSGLLSMLEKNSIAELRLMRDVLSLVSGGESLIMQRMRQEIAKKGLQLVNDPVCNQDPIATVQNLLQLKQKFDAILSGVFYVKGSSADPSATAQASGGSLPLTLRSEPEQKLLRAPLSAGSSAIHAASTGGDKMLSDVGRGSVTADHMLDKRYVNAVNQAFEEFVNAFNRIPEYLSLYLDKQLRTELKTASEDEVDARLSATVTLFRFLQDKDVFGRYYVQHLSKRLLNSRGPADEAERLFVIKLKNECGVIYTAKMETMFQDMKTSEELVAAFRAQGIGLESGPEQKSANGADSGIAARRGASSVVKSNEEESKRRSPTNGNDDADDDDDDDEAVRRGNAKQPRLSSAQDPIPNSAFDLNVSVLTTGSWPLQTQPLCELPAEVMRKLRQFETLYHTRYDGRKISWQSNLGSAELNAWFSETGRAHSLVVTTHMMCVLMLFNARDSITYDEICAETRIPTDDLERTLQTLALGKQRILSKEPATKAVQSGDVFKFNAKFTSKTFRVRIQSVSATKETDQQQEVTQLRLESDRKPQIEAAIVRVMKARRVMEHNNLIVETANQLSQRFTPLPADIKPRIESLIEREFLARDESNHRVYRYIA